MTFPSSGATQRNTKLGRFYTVGEQEYPSVTTILTVISKPALVNWAARVEREMVIDAAADLYVDCPLEKKMERPTFISTLNMRIGKAKAAQKELTKAAEIGSQAHALIEWTLLSEVVSAPGPQPKISEKAALAFAAWQKWRDTVKLKPILVEQTIWSKEFCYAGTMDLLAEMDGKLTVVDWKTGKAIYPESFLQNAAYRHALREMGHGNPVQGMIVRLPKVETDPEFEVADAGDETENFEVFLHALDLWKWQYKNEQEYHKNHAEKKEIAV